MLLAAVCALPCVAAAPAAAQSTGGAEYGAATPPGAESILLSRRAELLGRTLTFKGVLEGTRPGEAVELQRLDRKDGWVPAASTVVDADGTFLAGWRTSTIGRMVVRAVPLSGATARAANVGPTREITVFRPALATWYGPGFYGRRTACGRRMTRSLQGVAHRTLPCGTEVDLFYKGRTATVPVVDRGPFRPGTSWDLTAATARRLGFRYTDTIGAARVRPE